MTRDEATDTLDERKSRKPPLPDIRKMTSGTTGRPLTFAYDRGSEYWRQATKLRGYAWAGYRPGDRSLHFWGSVASVQRPGSRERVKQGLDHLLRREHYVNCADLSEAALDQAVSEIRKFRPTVIVCYAQAGAALARHIVESKRRDWSDIAIISAAERLFPADRAVMTEAFGPQVFETYGSREVMLIASECPAHAGLHVSMENLIVEVVVREDGKTRLAKPGELGEVVVTDLHNYGAPFVRYVNGDLAIALADERCSCGRSLRRLATVEGRANDTLRDGAGRPVSGMFFAVLFSTLADKVRRFQVVQRRDRSVELKLVPGIAFDESLLDVVRRNCGKFLPGVVLRTEVVPDIPVPPSGKQRVVMVES
jgi:phenylacetate-CoA ligase